MTKRDMARAGLVIAAVVVGMLLAHSGWPIWLQLVVLVVVGLSAQALYRSMGDSPKKR